MSICWDYDPAYGGKFHSEKGFTEWAGRLAMDDMNGVKVCESGDPEELSERGDGGFGEGFGDFKYDDPMEEYEKL
jgi:hypothetical protein